MVPKKVGSITLEYDPGDGNLISEAFDAEFHNALITGDVSGLNGYFSGKLTANAVDAIDNLHITGRAAAITSVKTIAWADSASHGFDDDGVYRTICDQVIVVPEGMSGAYCAVAIQYEIDDAQGDNDMFICRYRLLQDGKSYYTNARAKFGLFYEVYPHQIHEMVMWFSGAGSHTVSMQWLWEPNNTNVYPIFKNITIRTDLIRK